VFVDKPIITFEQKVPDTTASRVYQTIEEWLGSQNAKIKKSQPPSFIEASHGRWRQPRGWKKDAKKTIIFSIEQQERDVLVRVDLRPAQSNALDVRDEIGQARASWNELLSDLWARLGGVQTHEEVVVDPSMSERGGSRLVYGGIIVLLIGIMGELATLILAYDVGILFLFLISMGLLAMVSGARNARLARKRLARHKHTSF
jgi:hypothetical protein